MRVARFELQVEPSAGSLAFVVGELQFHIDMLLFGCGDVEALLVRATDARAGFQRE